MEARHSHSRNILLDANDGRFLILGRRKICKYRFLGITVCSSVSMEVISIFYYYFSVFSRVKSFERRKGRMKKTTDVNQTFENFCRFHFIFKPPKDTPPLKRPNVRIARAREHTTLTLLNLNQGRLFLRFHRGNAVII